ncbi:hypothetical protein LWI29_023148 [Acer saccharum]|uniref:Uncharacterized protein n=1 Tax=Acer saccharum TaxID=4024 RepID=A0AA39VY20_ACESA|nr:hypothetical protein LWI29_023148 [Acer saccharum]
MEDSQSFEFWISEDPISGNQSWLMNHLDLKRKSGIDSSNLSCNPVLNKPAGVEVTDPDVAREGGNLSSLDQGTLRGECSTRNRDRQGDLGRISHSTIGLKPGSKECVEVLAEKEISGQSMEGGEEGEIIASQLSDMGMDELQYINKKGRGRPRMSVVKTHGMRTRLNRSKEPKQSNQEEPSIEIVDIVGKHLLWSLEEEITKVIETGVAIGAIKNRQTWKKNDQAEKATTVVDFEGNNLMWCLDEEISKVIETGVALGLDFGRNEITRSTSSGSENNQSYTFEDAEKCSSKK